jgi:hypothetical protein
MNIFLGNKPEKKHVQALYRTSADDMKNLVDLMELKLGETKDSLVTATDIQQIHRLQGKASVIKDFLEAINKSSEVLERYK